MDIEKLAHSVFENAEQEPPREVWREIESRLQAAVPPKPQRHWHWAAVSGAVVVLAAAAIVAINVIYPDKPQMQVAFVDSSTIVEEAVPMKPLPVGESDDSTVAESMCQPKETMQREETEMLAVANVANSQTKREKKTVATDSPSAREEEPFFDLLEYQLSSHEYDIPSETHTTPKATHQKESKREAASETKEENKSVKENDTLAVNLFIPNILSPNGDGYNDCWVIPGLTKYGKVSVRIYTSQSKRVFASDDYCGDFCGDNLPSGNYFYEIKLQSCNHVRRGVLVIKR